MFQINDDLDILMFEKDYGERLPITILDGDVLPSDSLKFIIQKQNHETVIEKELQLDTENSELDTYIFFLTQQESQDLIKGKYLWGLKQYRDDYLIDTLCANKNFQVIRGQ